MAKRIHLVPTHISTPERVLSIGPLSLTAKQFLLLLLGSALGYNLWQHLTFLSDVLPVRLCLALIPVVISASLALLHPAGRSPDQWGVVLLRFSFRPRLALWRSLRHAPEQLYPLLFEEESAAQGKRASARRHQKVTRKKGLSV
jgi:hypothetical protein